MENEKTGVKISNARYSSTGVLEIRHKDTHELTGWKITLAGPSHPKTLEVRDRQTDRYLQREQEKEKAIVNRRKYKGGGPDVHAVRLQHAEDTAARILDWVPVDLDDGRGVIHFSEAAAIEMLLDPDLIWVANQIQDYFDDEKSFTKASATTS